MSDDPRAQLLDDVWCATCLHVHIGGIPSTTFRCWPRCGFGGWSPEVAAEHAAEFPGHIVHPVHHATVPIAGAELVHLRHSVDRYPLCWPQDRDGEFRGADLLVDVTCSECRLLERQN